MHEGEIEYEFNEGAANRATQKPSEEVVQEVASRLALLRNTYGQAAATEAIKRATVTEGASQG